MLLRIYIFALAVMVGFFPQQHTASFNTQPASNSLRWVVDKSSTLRVKGKSNINTFNCEIMGYSQDDTISITSIGTGGSVKLNGLLQVAVTRFNCYNKLITGDLRKTLKAAEHPTLTVRFLSLERAPEPGKSSQVIKGWLEVELAGVKKVMQIPFVFGSNTNFTTLDGEKLFCFSDFNLTPPAKVAGLVKIKDEFAVDFNLRLRLLD